MTHTPQQLADFATMIVVTPDTHPHLRKWHNKVHDDRYHQEIDAEKLPPLDTPEGDDVYLARFMRWLMSQRVNYKVGPSFADNPHEAFAATPYPDDTVYAPTATLALLRACQAARVPEIVKIFPLDGFDK
jgi:hypothetical protein